MAKTTTTPAIRRALRCVHTAAKNKRRAERTIATAYRRYDVACRRLDMAIVQYQAAYQAQRRDDDDDEWRSQGGKFERGTLAYYTYPDGSMKQKSWD